VIPKIGSNALKVMYHANEI